MYLSANESSCDRDHPASEVYVTGTFDDWAKSVKLDAKPTGRFEKLVQLSSADQKILYKVSLGECTYLTSKC